MAKASATRAADVSWRRTEEQALYDVTGGGGWNSRVAEKGIKGIVVYKTNFTMTAETSRGGGGVTSHPIDENECLYQACEYVCVICCVCVCVCVYLIPDAMPLSIPTSWITGNCPSFCCKAQNQDKTDISI